MVLHLVNDEANVGFSDGCGSIASPETSAEFSTCARNDRLGGGGG